MCFPISAARNSWKGGPSFYRGGDGPLATQMTRFTDPLVDAFAAAGRAAGHKATPDYNGAQQEGFGVWQMTVKNGRRCSAADAYLRPALARNNLTVEVGALATKLVFDGRRAAGVEYIRHGETVTAHAEREVILCGGVVNSPQLLMLSGIGDPDELRRHDIGARVALPGVGKNLQDHISAAVAYDRKEPGPFHHAMRFDRIVPSLARAYLRGEGIATELPTGVMAFLKTKAEVALPDVQFIFNAAPMTAQLISGRSGLPTRMALPAGSRSFDLRVEAGSSSSPPTRDSPYASGRISWRPTMTGKRCARGCVWRATYAGRNRCSPFIAREIAPGEGVVGDADFDAHIRANSITVHHPLGTCKMGVASDPLAVVDAELRVFGTEGLRVVDGAAMPDLVGANINAPIIMIAEKAADLIRGRKPLEAARLTGAPELSRH